ncbi:hypothetical protein SDC9_140954 [bioreactor metagenome]|uniref:Uncharacterized protein n=1 Tax=bioreactor metagenome TaxID=1076179 RepID=A0A645DZQ6_9ZZZZ
MVMFAFLTVSTSLTGVLSKVNFSLTGGEGIDTGSTGSMRSRAFCLLFAREEVVARTMFLAINSAIPAIFSFCS